MNFVRFSKVLLGGMLLLNSQIIGELNADEIVVGKPLPAWQKGHLDIHQINTGLGDSALLVLPDGTSVMVDAGALLGRTLGPNYDAPIRPNNSRRAGEWIAHYIRKVHPQAEKAELDYAVITHFHSDHMGTVTPDAPRSSNGAYQLAGITDVAEQLRIHRLLDRGAPDYQFPKPFDESDMMKNYFAFVRWQTENGGMKVERFEVGRNDQIKLLKAPHEFPQFEIRNIAVNGYVWAGQGLEKRSRYPHSDPPDENNSSFAFRLRYGKFDYFNGGDITGQVPGSGRFYREMESAVAWVVGPVDVHVLNHHGYRDSTNPFFLSVLQPRVYIGSIYASSHPGVDVMRNMLSEKIYPGPRDVFFTNALWEGRRPNMVKLFGEEDTAWLEKQIQSLPGSQGHIVVRVASGGESYQVIMLDDSEEHMLVKSVHGPYLSR